VTRDGASVAVPRKPLAVLTYLALTKPGRFVKRDTLLGVFWPDLDQSRARGSLRQALLSLRHALGAEVVLTEGDDDVALNHELVQCDATAFEQAIGDGQLRTAAELYGGPVASGLYLKGCPEFEHWLDGQRGPFQRSYEETIEQLADTARSGGDHRRAADWLGRLLQVDLLQGRVVTLLMEELEAGGVREEAIRVGDEYVANLKRELDAEPDPRVRDLLDRLRNAPALSDTPKLAVAKPLRLEIEMVREALQIRYDILEELKRGVLGKVFLGWDQKLKRHVAVKVLRPELRQAVGGERFLQEISIVAQFNHPNIVTLFEADEIGGFLYYTMRHIPGEPLDARIRREGYVPIDDAIKIAANVGRGLEYSHEHDVLHRDVQPSNVLLHEQIALITDFGLAMAVAGGGKRFTDSGVWVGSPAYMSPEQAGVGGPLDGRSDVYALGCVLYKMLVGEHLFSGPTPQAIIAKHKGQPVPAIRIARPEVPQTLQDVVERALAKAPDDRFASAGAFADAVEQVR
jgi:DNA-binding SARP family transcriptional activator/tRNA A-37 threonylcarbamoyl transferase component Bud32